MLWSELSGADVWRVTRIDNFNTDSNESLFRFSVKQDRGKTVGMRQDKWTKEKATLLHLESLNTSHIRRQWQCHPMHKDHLYWDVWWHDTKTADKRLRQDGVRVIDQVTSGVRVTLPAPQLTEVQQERGERHTNQQKKNGKNKGLNQRHLRIKHSSVKIHIPTSTKVNRGRVRLQDGMLHNPKKPGGMNSLHVRFPVILCPNSAHKALNFKLRGMSYKAKLFSSWSQCELAL